MVMFKIWQVQKSSYNNIYWYRYRLLSLYSTEAAVRLFASSLDLSLIPGIHSHVTWWIKSQS